MQTINLTQLAQRAHAINRKNGFWDPEPPIERSIVLMFGELFEAVEADRKGKWFRDEPEREFLKRTLSTEFDEVLFKRLVKDTVEDEVADTVIRALDILVGHFKKDDFITSTPQEYIDGSPDDIFKLAYDVIASKERGYNNADIVFWVLGSSIYFFLKHNLDLYWHIEMKLNYNETRSFKHGKLY